MVGRNDPCPCGSGKKYKKCCQSNDAISVEEVQAAELERVLQHFYEEYPERKDVPEYIELADQWKKPLLQYLPEEMIEAIVLDEFFFHYRLDIWQEYLARQKKKNLRPSVLSVVEGWNEPSAFIGEVTDIDDAYMTVENIIDRSTLRLRRENEKPVPIGAHLFCFILPDESAHEDHYLAVSTLIFFPTDHAEVIKRFANEYDDQEMQSVSTYLKEHGIDFWIRLGEDGYEGGEFTNFEAGVLLHITDFLEKHGRASDKLLETIEDFLVEQQPNARKEAAIAAGAIRFGQEQQMFEPLPLTLKELAEWFHVSTASMNKYYKELSAYGAVTES